MDERHFKNLEIILAAAQDEFKLITYDRRAMQHAILRNYAWLSSILFGAQCMLLGQMPQGEVVFLGVLVVAIIVNCVCFGYCIDTMRGRGLYAFPYMGLVFKELIDMEEYQMNGEVPSYSDKPHDADDMHRTMILRLQSSIDANRQVANVVGKKLRRLSVILMVALPLTAVAALGCFRNLFGI